MGRGRSSGNSPDCPAGGAHVSPVAGCSRHRARCSGPACDLTVAEAERGGEPRPCPSSDFRLVREPVFPRRSLRVGLSDACSQECPTGRCLLSHNGSQGKAGPGTTGPLCKPSGSRTSERLTAHGADRDAGKWAVHGAGAEAVEDGPPEEALKPQNIHSPSFGGPALRCQGF